MTDEQTANSPLPEALSFEQALERLEAIVRELEEGRVGLSEGLAHYEEGVKLLRQCYQAIECAERRIELLSRVDSAGNEVCEPFDEGAASLEEKSRQRGRRRSRPAQTNPTPDEDEIDGPGRLF
jgi:exodeoxyribonuclease VII small subunit